MTSTKKSPTEFVGPVFAIVTGVLALLTAATHIYWSSQQQLDTGKTLLLNLLTLTFSTACTIWVGRWSARGENKAFIRAALRTTYGLHEALQAAERSALDGMVRMKARDHLTVQVSSEFWEELVGRVLDQVRGVMRQSQETVENWKEFGPEEVALLTAAETTKTQAVDEVELAVEQARAMLRDLKELGVYDTAALRTRLDALEQEKARITATSAFAIPATGEARRLLALGASEEAVAAYSSLIAAAPQNYTLYVARARARYLAGDTAGALQDLDVADRKRPDDPFSKNLRDDIVQGRKPAPVTLPVPPEYKEHVFKGNNALAVADSDGALKHFERARDAGLMPIFAAENKAMALLLGGKYEEARAAIAEVRESVTGPFVKAQALMLVALADALENVESDSAEKLQSCILELRVAGMSFDLSASALQFLLRGLAKQNALNGRAQAIVDSVKAGRPF